MATPDSAEEARLLRDLLADAHTRIRELQSRLDQYADELLTLKLNDRRRATGSHGDVERERHRSGVHAAESEGARRGRGRYTGSPTLS